MWTPQLADHPPEPSRYALAALPNPLTPTRHAPPGRVVFSLFTTGA